MRIAFAQMDVIEDDPGRNRARITEFVEEAAAGGARLLALPELWASGYDLSRAARPERADEWSGDFALLLRLSAEHDIAILGGSLLESVSSAADGSVRFRNCAIAVESGEELGRYRKRHRFRPLGEDAFLDAGDTPPEVFSIAGVRAAMTICYDLRFPELYRPLALSGAELIHVPAQWPLVRIEHWTTLLRARAIETQAYILGVNRRGRYGEFEFGGASALFGPRGECIAAAGDALGLVFAEIDEGEVHAWRTAFPYLEDRIERS